MCRVAVGTVQTAGGPRSEDADRQEAATVVGLRCCIHVRVHWRSMGKIYKNISCLPSRGSIHKELGIDEGVRVTEELLLDLMVSRGLTGNMNSMLGSLIVEDNLWDAALRLGRNDDRRIAFRASWALEWAYVVEPQQIEKRFAAFLNDLLATRSESVQRVYSKMLCDMIRRGAVSLNDSEAEAVTERCFDLLTGESTPVAVKVWQIELLYDLVPRIEWVEENLSAIVRGISESEGCSPAMAAHARNYFRRIGSRKRKGNDKRIEG